jgi:hypothetical protein
LVDNQRCLRNRFLDRSRYLGIFVINDAGDFQGGFGVKALRSWEAGSFCLSTLWAASGSCVVELISIASVPSFLLYLESGQLRVKIAHFSGLFPVTPGLKGLQR